MGMLDLTAMPLDSGCRTLLQTSGSIGADIDRLRGLCSYPRTFAAGFLRYGNPHIKA